MIFVYLKHLQKGTAHVSHVFDSKEEVMQMGDPSVRREVKREMEREINFKWESNEDVSLSFSDLHSF